MDAAAIPHAIKETSSSKAGTKIGEIPLFGRVNLKKWKECLSSQQINTKDLLYQLLILHPES